MADLIGPGESRLLALERKVARAEDALRQSRRALVGVQQGLFDTWSGVRVPIGTPAPAPCDVVDFAYCPCLPLTIPLNDSYYGNVTLTYDYAQLAWFGCANVTLPA